jgi:hypothetical protein
LYIIPEGQERNPKTSGKEEVYQWKPHDQMQAHSSNATQNQIHEEVVKKLLPTKSYYATHNALSTIMQLTKIK